ncbi:MAG TPA: hypothetical protein VFV05_15810 [Methylomirabilota bacterium]|nr:hypothetical protein [Methylomirabilota bacterium]
MARHRTLVRLSRALRAAAVAVAAAAATTVLFEAELGRGLAMPSWKVATAPPVLYLTLAMVALRHLPLDRRVGWMLAACGVNVALALASALTLSLVHPMSLEGALLRALWTYVPGPIVHLVAAPLMMLAWRSRVVPVRAPARAARPPVEPPALRATGPALAVATPNWDSVLRLSSLPAWSGGPGPTAFGRGAPELKIDEPASEPEPTTVLAAESLERTAHVGPRPAPVDVSASPPVVVRAAPEPPAVPAPPLALRPAPRLEPPDEPMVRVPFGRIAAQLPPDAFLLPAERLAESLREPHQLVVPRRLVVPQLREGVVEVAWPLIEDQFPELAFAVPPAEMRHRFSGWVLSLPMDEVVRQVPPELWRLETPAADLSDIGQFAAPFDPVPPVAAPVAASEPTPVRVIAEPRAPAPAVIAAVAVPAPLAPEPSAIEPGPIPVPPVPPTAEVADEESEALARTLALGLAPLGAFDWQTQRVGGRALVSFVPPSLVREPIDALAVRAAALAEYLAPWAVEQMTIRTAHVACVLTPLGGRGCLAAGVRRNGAVAMLELLSARAARTTGAGPAVAAPVTALKPATMAPAGGGNGHRRLAEAARALAPFGPVASSVAAAEDAAPGVYVFAGHDGGLLAGVARAVHAALVAGHDHDALGRLESVELRRGRERAVMRPLRAHAGAPAMLAASGEVALAGRAHRAAAHAAALLETR